MLVEQKCYDFKFQHVAAEKVSARFYDAKVISVDVAGFVKKNKKKNNEN